MNFSVFSKRFQKSKFFAASSTLKLLFRIAKMSRCYVLFQIGFVFEALTAFTASVGVEVEMIHQVGKHQLSICDSSAAQVTFEPDLVDFRVIAQILLGEEFPLAD
jgi:hypothetical protein